VTLSVDLECVEIIRAAAAPIAPHRRPRFYERVSDQRAEAEFRIAPEPAVDAPRPSPPTPRSPYHRP